MSDTTDRPGPVTLKAAGVLEGRLGLPEHQLMYAVLADTIAVITSRGAHAALGRGRLLALEWPFSVRNVCDELGVDTADLRRQLTRWLERGGRACCDM